MKKSKLLHIISIMLCMILFLFSVFSISSVKADDNHNESINSWMPNPKFQALVLDNMKQQGILDSKSNVNDITKDDMTKLKWIDNYYYTNNLSVRHQFDLLSNRRGVDSYSIEGLQYAKNLISLQLTNVSDSNVNGQTTLGYDSGYQLLRGDITDVSPIANLSNLKYVWLNGNRISDVSPIVQLQNYGNIKYLNLFANSIYDFSGLDNNEYTANKSDINTTKLGGAPSIGVTGSNSSGNLLALQIDQQFATLKPVYVNSRTNSYTLNINKLVKLPNNNKIQNASVFQTLPNVLENNSNPAFAFIHFNTLTNGANANDVGNGIFQYSNLPVQRELNPNNIGYYHYISKNPDIIGIFNHSPEYQNYMVIADNDNESFYSIPYVNYDPDTVATVTVHYVDENGDKINNDTKINGSIGNNYTTYPKNINDYNLAKKPDNAIGNFINGNIDVTYVYNKNQPSQKNGTVNVNYVDDKGNKLADSESISGNIGDKYITKAKNINGYTLTKSPDNADGTYGKDNITITYVYSKNIIPNNNSSNNVPNTNSNNSSVKPNSNANTNKPCNCKCPTKIIYVYVNKKESNQLSKKYKGLAVYALKKINMYKQIYENSHKLNNKKNIVYNYIKKPRIKAPMFVVNKVIKLSNGKTYYHVLDVNNKAKTKHLKGYITANNRYVTKVYYNHKPATFTVINPQGVKNTRKLNLTDVIKTFPQGTILKFKKIAKHHLTTRYVLPNGTYITGNKKLVQLGKHYQVRKIRTKKNIYLYKNIDLTYKKKLIKKNALIKVKYYDYSYRYNFHKRGSKVYLVHGGYITANNKAIKIVK